MSRSNKKSNLNPDQLAKKRLADRERYWAEIKEAETFIEHPELWKLIIQTPWGKKIEGS